MQFHSVINAFAAVSMHRWKSFILLLVQDFSLATVAAFLHSATPKQDFGPVCGVEPEVSAGIIYRPSRSDGCIFLRIGHH
jgi:hypothetical protein